MRKKELLDRIEKLEKRNKELEFVADFLSQYDRDEIVVTYYLVSNFELRTGTLIKYLYGANLVSVKIPYHEYIWCEIMKKTAESIILRFNNGNWNDEYSYYEIDKANGTFHVIPKPAFVLEQELAEKEELAKKEKASGNKKRTKGGEQAK